MKYLKIVFFITCLSFFSLSAMAQSTSSTQTADIPVIQEQTLEEIAAEQQRIIDNNPVIEQPEYDEATLELIRQKELRYAEEARKEEALRKEEESKNAAHK